MKNKILRFALNGVILSAIAAIGIAAYQIGTSPTEEKIIQEMENSEDEKVAKVEKDLADAENLNEIDEWDNIDELEVTENSGVMNDADSTDDFGETDEMETSGNLETAKDMNAADDLGETDGLETSDNFESVNAVDETGTLGEVETNDYNEEEISVNSDLIDIEVVEDDGEVVNTSAKSMLEQLHFSEVTEMVWPANGEILLNYNMNQSIYFPTLDQYKLNPAIVMKAEVDTPVLAAASGMVYDISDNAQTGTTVIMELGDGYQAIYGQLKDLTVEEGELIEKGTVLGYVNEPTKYYSVEGSNVYFSMKENGKYINPETYLSR